MNKIKTLIPLSEFVSKIDEICPRQTDQMYDLWKLHQLGLITRYNNFLLQPLKIGMFFPADEDGNIVTEPSYRQYEESNYLEDLYKIYNNAKNSVLFESISKIQGKHYVESYSKVEGISYIVNSLIPIKLTEQALKQIYG